MPAMAWGEDGGGGTARVAREGRGGALFILAGERIYAASLEKSRRNYSGDGSLAPMGVYAGQ